MPLCELAIDASRAVRRVRTGTEWYSVEIIRALAQLPERPHLSLYVPPVANADKVKLPARVTSRIVRAPRFWTHAGLSAALRRDKPDALFVPSHVIPAMHPRVSVVTVHDLGYRYFPETHPPAQRRMLELSTRWNARAAHHIIAISQQTKRDLVQHYNVADERISVIYHGVDHRRFRRLETATVDKRLRELGVTRPFLLYVGSIQPRKNLARLVEAFRALGRDDLSLAIVGQTAWCTNKSLPFEVEGVSDLLLLGYVASDDLQVLYNSAEAFVFPSLFEGFGMPVLEAMACGCPVVTSRTSSLPEVAGDAAVFVDPTDVESIRDGIQEALSTSRRPELVQRGLERAAVFTWDATASLTLAAIRAAYGG